MNTFTPEPRLKFNLFRQFYRWNRHCDAESIESLMVHALPALDDVVMLTIHSSFSMEVYRCYPENVISSP